MIRLHFKLIIGTALCLFMNQGFSQSGPRWYYNVDKENIAIGGYDVVAYYTENQAIKGNELHGSLWQGNNYLFSSASHKATFEIDPEKYLPAHGGWCTFFMGIDQEATQFPPTRMASDPTNFKIIDGKLYLFRKTPSQNFLEMFNSGDQKAILKRATKFWKSRVSLSKKAEGRPKGLNPMARMENLKWETFMGKWEAQVQWWNDTTGTSKSIFKGEWEFRYGYNGYCIQDDFMSVPDLPFAGTQNGPAIRGYDVQNHEWHMTYIPVNQPRANTWLMTANFIAPGYLVGQLESQDPLGNAILQRVIFKKIDQNTFEWQADWSWDEGKTWREKTGFATVTRTE